MRILHVIPSYVPAYRYGGPIYSVHGLCKALTGLKHDVHVFTTNVNGDNDSNVPLGQPVDIDGVKVWYFPSMRLRRIYWSPPLQRELEKQINEFDILHLHSIFLWPTWAAARAAREARKPYIIAPRGMLVKELFQRKSRFAKNLWIKLIEKKNLEHAAAIHVTTEKEKEETKKFNFNFPPLFVVPNGFDIDELNKNPDNVSPYIAQVIKKKPFLLFLGRINWKKGLDRLIPALRYVPDIQLIIAGNDEENYRPKMEKLAESHSVIDRITFAGQVSGTDKVALLENASVLVLPSYSENFGNVVLEAMAVGCPVVVTPEVGISDIVQKSGAGVVVKGEPEMLGKEIRSLLLNSHELKEMGKRGQKMVEKDFTWLSIAKIMESIYKSIQKKQD
jgi:glycosyltransferase involved in cell wall biosynthesis